MFYLMHIFNLNRSCDTFKDMLKKKCATKRK